MTTVRPVRPHGCGPGKKWVSIPTVLLEHPMDTLLEHPAAMLPEHPMAVLMDHPQLCCLSIPQPCCWSIPLHSSSGEEGGTSLLAHTHRSTSCKTTSCCPAPSQLWQPAQACQETLREVTALQPSASPCLVFCLPYPRRGQVRGGEHQTGG